MVEPGAKPKYEDLRQRLVAAGILAGIALVATIMGGFVFAVFVAAMLMLAMSEWTTLVAAETLLTPRADLSATVGVGVVAVISWLSPMAGWILFPLFMIALLLANNMRFGWRSWAGFAALTLAGISAIAIREADMAVFLWIVIAVIAVDIGGYFCGKQFGGPKLWSAVSPKKTWSGALGGLALAILVSILAARGMDTSIGPAILFAILITVIGISGDLLESMAKRHFGVKDTGSILPGHGGLLDRCDALIFVLCLFALVSLLFDPIAALGRS